MATKSKGIEYYEGLSYTVEIKHDEDGWFAKVVELPGCMTWADSFEELGPMIEDVKLGWIEDALEHGDPVPEPKNTEGYSGKVNLRMPKSLHRDLARTAQKEGVSLNQFMVANLARSVNEARAERPPTAAATNWTQVAADALGVAVEDLKLLHVDRIAVQAAEESIHGREEAIPRGGVGDQATE